MNRLMRGTLACALLMGVACGDDDGGTPMPVALVDGGVTGGGEAGGGGGGGGGSGGGGNAAACERYVRAVNSLPCFSGAAELNVEMSCAGFRSTACDISAYFDCLVDNTSCMDVGGMSIPDSSGVASCASLNRCD